MGHIRNLMLIAFILTLTTVLTLNGTQAFASAVLAPHSVAIAVDPQCPPNSEETKPSSARLCVAELVRSTRSGLQAKCMTVDPVEMTNKALKDNPWYRPWECHGGRGVQAEAIAQARAIARLNKAGVYGDQGGKGQSLPTCNGRSNTTIGTPAAGLTC